MAEIIEIKYGICDWNGTFKDDREHIFEAVNLLRATYGLQKTTFQEFLRFFNPPYHEHVAHFGLKLEYEEFWNTYKECIKLTAHKFPKKLFGDAIQTLEFLREKDIELAIVSSMPPTELEKDIEHFKLKGYFMEIISGVQSFKKDEAMKSLLERRNWDAKRAFSVGDIAEDAKAGHANNIANVISVATGYDTWEQLEKGNPHYLIQALYEMSQLGPFQ